VRKTYIILCNCY